MHNCLNTVLCHLTIVLNTNCQLLFYKPNFHQYTPGNENGWALSNRQVYVHTDKQTFDNTLRSTGSFRKRKKFVAGYYPDCKYDTGYRFQIA